MCTLDADFADLLDGIENDYALTLAQKGICLNLTQVFEGEANNPEKQQNYTKLLQAYSEASSTEDKLQMLDELETLYNTWTNNKTDEELNFKSGQTETKD